MSYTLEEFYINSLTADKVLSLWVDFCLKSPPLLKLQAKSFSKMRDLAVQYFRDNFYGKRCFYSPNNGFAVFAEGQDGLDKRIESFEGKRVAVLFMGATINGGFHSLMILRDCFRRLKNSGYDIVAWNQNREFRRKPFERLMKKLGAKQIDDCFYVEI